MYVRCFLVPLLLVPLSWELDNTPSPISKWSFVQINERGELSNTFNAESLTPYEIFQILKDDEKERETLPCFIWDFVLACIQFEGSIITKTNDILSISTWKVLSVESAQEALRPLKQSKSHLNRWVPIEVLQHLGRYSPE